MDPYAEWGAGADVVADIQADLVTEWLARKVIPTTDERAAVQLVADCGEALWLPAGHVATVFVRLGHEWVGATYLKVTAAAAKLTNRMRGKDRQEAKAEHIAGHGKKTG